MRIFTPMVPFALSCALLGACLTGGGDDDDDDDSPDAAVACAGNEECAYLDGECTAGVCGASGVCAAEPANEGLACDDGDLCTEGEACESGACGGGLEPDCGAWNGPCALGVCDPATGLCEAAPVGEGTGCEDGDLCTTGEACWGGECSGGLDVECPPSGDGCAVGVCDPFDGSCALAPVNEGGGCEDDDLCTLGETCQSGYCLYSEVVDCSAYDSDCSIGSCDAYTGTCDVLPVSEGNPCDDGDPCTSGTTCTSTGTCSGGTAIDCSYLDGPCGVGSCDPAGGCIALPVAEGAACDDGDACTSGELCGNGVCGGLASTLMVFAEDFSDNSAGWTLGTEWQIGAATASTGHTDGFGDPADDHSPTADDGVAGVVIGGNAGETLHGFYYLESPPVNLSTVTGSVYLSYWRWLNSDYDPYMHSTVDVWTGSTWVNLFTVVSPGTFDSAWTFRQHDVTAYKNSSFRVRFGVDVGSTEVWTVSSWNLDDLALTRAACDTTYGCVTAVPTDCSAYDGACAEGTCNPVTGSCYAAAAPAGTACDDGSACTTDDACSGTTCTGAPVVCASGPCVSAYCDATSGCVSTNINEGLACDDGSTCTSGTICTSGACTGGTTTPPHSECVTGAALPSACTDCSAAVCASQPSCCSTTWGTTCTNLARTLCGVCQVGTCTHALCTTGVALVSGCDASFDDCVATVCYSDSFCCNATTGSWDSTCVGEVDTYCGLACG